MERPKPATYKLVLGAVAFTLIGFLGGQIAPRVVPASWTVATNRLDFNDLNQIYTILQDKFDGDIDSSKVMDGAKAGVVSAAGDPYTVFLDAKSANALRDQLSGTLSGIGAEVGVKNNRLTIIAPVAGSPAEKAGLKPGDIVTKIDSTDTSNLTLDEAVSKIRGNKGTDVTLKIVRGNTEPTDIKITRDTISVPSVKSSMKSGNIGYIQISQFGDDTNTKIAAAATELKNQGAQKVILDLRNNPGGYLDSAVAVSSQFMPENKVVVEERRNGKTTQKLSSSGGGSLVGLPMVVLINEGSASASEITAGALKDNGAAKLIGEKSFGKGSVQEVIKLAGGAELKITVAHWFTPSGKGIDKIGISPDIEVKQDQADYNADRDPQLDRAIQELNKS
jgi:carboxyl-terminal processing protease